MSENKVEGTGQDYYYALQYALNCAKLTLETFQQCVQSITVCGDLDKFSLQVGEGIEFMSYWADEKLIVLKRDSCEYPYELYFVDKGIKFFQLATAVEVAEIVEARGKLNV